MCVIHADAWALNAISRNNKVFMAPRNDANTQGNFGAFHMVAAPIGNPAVPIRNTDGLPSVYALTETWFRGGQYNEAFRAQVVPIRRDPSDAGSGAAWYLSNQDFTGTWRSSSRFFSLTDRSEYIPELDQTNDDQLPQWMPVGDANRQMFACAGMRSEDTRVGTTWLTEATPTGSGSGPVGVMPIQDVLNGDSRFAPPPPAPLSPPPTGPPTPSITGPYGGYITDGIVQCAMTQSGDDIASRSLHLVAVRGRQLLYATLSNFGPVTQSLMGGSTRTFPRFRTVSPWYEILGLFPTSDFGDLVHVVALSTGIDQLLQVFFVGKTRNAQGTDIYRLWRTRRDGAGNWSTPVDVLQASGETANGTVYDMPISAAFCPLYGDVTGGSPQAEILLAWFEPLTNSILALEYVRQAKVWVPGRSPSVYSSLMRVEQTGIPQDFRVFRVRVSSRPFTDQ
jgi:hypothetical protein